MDRKTALWSVGFVLGAAVFSAIGLESAWAQDGRSEPAEITCPPLSAPITVDGRLDEWTTGPALILDEEHLVRRDEAYQGDADLSGDFYVARDATTLYVAGRVRDDTEFWNTRVPFLGDGVEIFLDFHPDPTSREEGGGYDEFSHQLLVHPLGRELRWSFARYKGVEGRMDDPIDGIRLAGLPSRDAKGATNGYTFEIALPLCNFTDEPLEEGRVLGFDIALSDSDGLPEQKNYATWSGRERLSEFPARFGRVILGGTPPPISAPDRRGISPTGPLAVLIAVVGALLFLLLARSATARGHWLAAALEGIRAVRLRPKLIAAGVIGVALALAPFGARWIADALLEREIDLQRETAQIVREIATEAARLKLLDAAADAGGDEKGPLVGLLTGRSIAAPRPFEYEVLSPRAEEPHRTLSGTPFLRRDVPAIPPWSDAFEVHPPAAARGASLIVSWRPDAGREAEIEPGAALAEVRFVRQDGRVMPPVRLRLGFELATYDAAEAEAVVPDAEVAFVETGDDGEIAGRAYQVDVAFPLDDNEAPIARIEYEPKSSLGRFVLHGVTLDAEPGTPARLLPLGRSTAGGVPTAAAPFPRRAALLELSKDNDWVALSDLNVRADRLWIVGALRRAYADTRYRAPVALVEVVFDDGSVEGPFRMENGVTVDAETEPARERGDDFVGELAFEWAEPGQLRRHFDVLALPLERRGRRVREIQFEFTGEDEVLGIAGVTIGAETTYLPAIDPRHLQSGDEGYRIPDESLQQFGGLEYTLFEDGDAVATTLPGDARERSLARRLSRDDRDAVAADPEGVPTTRISEGERLHGLLVPLPAEARGRVLEIMWRSEVEARVRGGVSLFRLVLVGLLTPLLVLVAADLIGRFRSLHVRLVVAFAAAAAVPIILATFAVPELVAAKIVGDESEAVLEKAAAVQRRVGSLRSLARQHAEDALRDDALQAALVRGESEDFRAGVAAALRDVARSISASIGGEARVALEIAPPAGSGTEPMVFPEEARFTVFKSQVINISDVLAYRFARLYASGVAKSFGTDDRVTLVVELPVGAAALDDAARSAGGEVHALLYTPRGYPLAGTLESIGEETDEERSRKASVLRRVLSEQRPVVEATVLQGSPYTVAYDVLREGTEPVALVATAVPRGGAEALLRRVEGVSLLVFGAGVVMQFLLAGLVVGSTTRRFRRTLGRAQMAAPAREEQTADELSDLDSALREIRRDRDVLRHEIGHLHDAVIGLGEAVGPEAVVERALEFVRNTVAPWGAAIVVRESGARVVTVLGGFRGDDAIGDATLTPDDAEALNDALRGESVVQLADLEDRKGVLADCVAVSAYPLAVGERAEGALLMLSSAEGRSPQRHHDEFVATLARHVGLALSSARLVRLAVRDPRTGAYVASFFEQRLSEEVDRAAAAKASVALVLVRADGLADDEAGRRARERVAQILRERAPARAFLGSLDGGVLALAVPESDNARADELANDVHRRVADEGISGLRLRSGVAACPEDAGSVEFLLAEARRALSDATAGRGADSSAFEDHQRRLLDSARALGAIFRSQKGVLLLETIERIAGSDLTILVEGETGTGKEVLADLVHRKSPRAGRPLVKVHCAAIPETLLESELFGYERGAFTGADQRKPGRFELAHGGTLFLDEIGDLPASTQVKLLRVLEDRTVEHLGGTSPIPIDVRVITATNHDLRAAVAAGRFREDLYYRLNAVSLIVPPLRARKEDIPALADEFVRRAAESAGRSPPAIAPDAMDLLYRHPWPGNVRELRNALEQAVVLSDGGALQAADLLPALQASTARAKDAAMAGGGDGLSDRQRRVLALLAERDWITNGEYCEIVGISTRTGLRDLRDLMSRGLLAMEGKRRGAKYRLP